MQVQDEAAGGSTRRKMPSLPAGEFAVVAPIPGLVVKVLAAAGDAIEKASRWSFRKP